MPEVNEVEVKVDNDYIYLYCDECIVRIPEFMIDTKRKITDNSGAPIKCDGCGKEIEDATS